MSQVYHRRKQRRYCNNLSFRLVSRGKNKDQTKTKTHFWQKKELANAVFASFSFMRQTGLEAPPLAETHAETGFLCPLLRRFCHKGIYRNLSKCAVVLCHNKDQTKTKLAKYKSFEYC